jgi:hypothetical protein
MNIDPALGAWCRENARSCSEPSTSLRGALATKQSSSLLAAWIASLALAMTMLEQLISKNRDDDGSGETADDNFALNPLR